MLIDRRRFLLSGAAGAMALGLQASFGASVAWADGVPASFKSKVDGLRQRARDLGIAQASARSGLEETDEFNAYKEELLDVMEGGETKGGASARSLIVDAGEALHELNQQEAQTPKQANDTVYNGPAVHREFKWNAETRKNYRDLFATCVIREDRLSLVERNVARMLKEPRLSAYKDIESRTGIPWYFVGAIHNLEASFNLTRHLHNGDSLKARTHQVPAGRPKIWNPPNDWATSAVDALEYEGFTTGATKRRGWGLEAMLYRFERYNGLGSRRRGIHTPYLWSYANHYTKGKYVADGVWSDEAVSQQIGAAVMLKMLIEMKTIEQPPFFEAV